MRRTLLLSFVAGILALSGALAGDAPRNDAPAAPAEAAEAKANSSISDNDLSLSPGSIFAVPNPAGVTWNVASPGDNQLFPRAFASAPPRIPHAIAEFEPLTLRNNGCLECHALDAGADAPELPASHRTDLRNRPGEVGTTVAGARYLCLACHVPTSDASAPRTSHLPGP